MYGTVRRNIFIALLIVGALLFAVNPADTMAQAVDVEVMETPTDLTIAGLTVTGLRVEDATVGQLTSIFIKVKNYSGEAIYDEVNVYISTPNNPNPEIYSRTLNLQPGQEAEMSAVLMYPEDLSYLVEFQTSDQTWYYVGWFQVEPATIIYDPMRVETEGVFVKRRGDVNFTFYNPSGTEAEAQIAVEIFGPGELVFRRPATTVNVSAGEFTFPVRFSGWEVGEYNPVLIIDGIRYEFDMIYVESPYAVTTVVDETNPTEGNLITHNVNAHIATDTDKFEIYVGSDDANIADILWDEKTFTVYPSAGLVACMDPAPGTSMHKCMVTGISGPADITMQVKYHAKMSGETNLNVRFVGYIGDFEPVVDYDEQLSTPITVTEPNTDINVYVGNVNEGFVNEVISIPVKVTGVPEGQNIYGVEFILTSEMDLITVLPGRDGKIDVYADAVENGIKVLANTTAETMLEVETLFYILLQTQTGGEYPVELKDVVVGAKPASVLQQGLVQNLAYHVYGRVRHWNVDIGIPDVLIESNSGTTATDAQGNFHLAAIDESLSITSSKPSISEFLPFLITGEDLGFMARMCLLPEAGQKKCTPPMNMDGDLGDNGQDLYTAQDLGLMSRCAVGILDDQTICGKWIFDPNPLSGLLVSSPARVTIMTDRLGNPTRNVPNPSITSASNDIPRGTINDVTLDAPGEVSISVVITEPATSFRARFDMGTAIPNDQIQIEGMNDLKIAHVEGTILTVVGSVIEDVLIPEINLTIQATASETTDVVLTDLWIDEDEYFSGDLAHGQITVGTSDPCPGCEEKPPCIGCQPKPYSLRIYLPVIKTN